MQKNEIRAEMDVVKIGIQSTVAFFFAILLLAAQQRLAPLEIYFLLSLAGLIGMTVLIRKYKYLGRLLDGIEGDKSAE
ncbi:MAG: hypothetical protein ABH874_08315 [Methanobacteriota archaeon]